MKSDPSAARQLRVGNGLRQTLRTGFGCRHRKRQLWGEWSAQRPRPVVDTLLAATAVVHDLVFVTRNETIFRIFRSRYSIRAEARE